MTLMSYQILDAFDIAQYQKLNKFSTLKGYICHVSCQAELF